MLKLLRRGFEMALGPFGYPTIDVVKAICLYREDNVAFSIMDGDADVSETIYNMHLEREGLILSAMDAEETILNWECIHIHPIIAFALMKSNISTCNALTIAKAAQVGDDFSINKQLIEDLEKELNRKD